MKEELIKAGKEILVETAKVIGYALVSIIVGALAKSLEGNKS